MEYICFHILSFRNTKLEEIWHLRGLKDIEFHKNVIGYGFSKLNYSPLVIRGDGMINCHQ